MSFLDYTGLAHLADKIKQKFVQTVNNVLPIEGNVTITNVATADNLTSEDATESEGNFIYRTSGGLTDINSGEATLMYIDGYSELVGHQDFSVNFTTDNNITLSCIDSTLLSSALGNTGGTYNLIYTPGTLSTSAVTSWTGGGGWTRNGSSIILDTGYGLEANGITYNSISITENGSQIIGATVVPSTFFGAVSDLTITSYTFIYQNIGDEETPNYKWTFNNTEATLNEYGITISGTPNENDTLTVTINYGTPQTTCTIYFQPYIYGTFLYSKPTSLVSTGFNQFNKNSSSYYMENYTIDNGRIVSQAGSYVCYCKATKDAPWGYMAYSAEGYITGIGWCVNSPEENTELITTTTENDLRTQYNSSIVPSQDGYVVVSVTNMEDLCIHTRWDVEEDNVYEEYTQPSVISFQNLQGMVDDTLTTLPISDYGLPAVGNVSDRLNLENKQYIQKIQRVENTTTNMANVIASGVDYRYTTNELDYNNGCIYYVLDVPITYSNVGIYVENDGEYEYTPISSKYVVNDFGTEEFTNTTISVITLMLYGENLRNKLKGNVLTISEQSDLKDNQIKSIQKNLLDVIYPVGSIYMSTSATNPENIWGGSWERIQGQFLFGATDNATGSGASYEAGATGGAAEHYHTTSGHTLTSSEMPKHKHTCPDSRNFMTAMSGDAGAIGRFSYATGGNNYGLKVANSTNSNVVRYRSVDETGGGNSHSHGNTGTTSNMPPFLAVYIWKRTA